MTRWQPVDIGTIIWIIKGENAVVRIDHERFDGWYLSARTLIGDWKDIAYFKEPNGCPPLDLPSVENKTWSEKDAFDKAEEIAIAMGYI